MSQQPVAPLSIKGFRLYTMPNGVVKSISLDALSEIGERHHRMIERRNAKRKAQRRARAITRHS